MALPLPRQTQQIGYRAQTRLLEPVDHKGLEQSRKSRPRLAPRHRDLVDSVLRTVHPGHHGHQDRSILAGVQMPPTAGPRIIARTGLTTDGARQLGLTRLKMDANLPTFHLQLNIYHLPGDLNAKDLPIEISIVHRPRLPGFQAPGNPKVRPETPHTR